MDEETQKEIDGMSYQAMLGQVRFAPPGHYLFCGAVGEYFNKVFLERQRALAPGEAARISKQVGWEL